MHYKYVASPARRVTATARTRSYATTFPSAILFKVSRLRIHALATPRKVSLAARLPNYHCPSSPNHSKSRSGSGETHHALGWSFCRSAAPSRGRGAGWVAAGEIINKLQRSHQKGQVSIKAPKCVFSAGAVPSKLNSQPALNLLAKEREIVAPKKRLNEKAGKNKWLQERRERRGVALNEIEGRLSTL